MNHQREYIKRPDSRVLLFSNRNLYDPLVWRCPFREFERIIQEVDGVDVLAPMPTSWYPYGRRLAMRLGEFAALPVNPGVHATTLDREYDMFITVPERVSELLHIKSIKNLREKCRKTVCWLPEFYYKDIPVYRSCVEVLKQFDYVIFMFVASDPFKPFLKGKSLYLPAGINTQSFCPFPNAPARCIDVLSIGRRAPVIHNALLRMAREDNKFYMYDTINALKALNLDEHRLMTANLAKRSRYFIVSPGKFDRPQETGAVSEFGSRYFEAAAAGALMIGMRPQKNPEFEKIFNWPDAVLDVPFTSDEIISVIHDFDKQPERQLRVRQENITRCLLEHDWVHRWEKILDLVDMQAMPDLFNRKRRLQEIAAGVEEDFLQQQVSGVRKG